MNDLFNVRNGQPKGDKEKLPIQREPEMIFKGYKSTVPSRLMVILGKFGR
jgi:hypothetical protein